MRRYTLFSSWRRSELEIPSSGRRIKKLDRTFEVGTPRYLKWLRRMFPDQVYLVVAQGTMPQMLDRVRARFGQEEVPGVVSATVQLQRDIRENPSLY